MRPDATGGPFGDGAEAIARVTQADDATPRLDIVLRGDEQAAIIDEAAMAEEVAAGGGLEGGRALETVEIDDEAEAAGAARHGDAARGQRVERHGVDAGGKVDADVGGRMTGPEPQAGAQAILQESRDDARLTRQRGSGRGHRGRGGGNGSQNVASARHLNRRRGR